MTAAERLRQLAGFSGSAAALLLAIGSGPTAGAALVDYSGLPTGTAAEHLLAEKRQQEFAPGGISTKPAQRQQHELAQAPGFALRKPASEAQASVYPPLPPAPAVPPTPTFDESAPPVPALADNIGNPAIEAPPLVATHFDLAALELAAQEAEQAALLRKRREDEALALILAIAETL